MSVDVNQVMIIDESRSFAQGLVRRGWVPATLLALVVASSMLIVSHPREAVWDQARLLEARFDGEHIPSPTRGFTTQLIVALQASWSPIASVAQNEQIRIIALVFYAVAVALLAGALLQRVTSQLLLLVFLFSSQYPFLWLSSELIVGGLLCLTLWCWATERPVWLSGVLASLLALCKPDLILLACVLVGIMAWEKRDRRQALVLLGSFAGGIGLLLLPGLLSAGLGYFDTYTAASGGRSLQSFKQHFAALIASLQVIERGPNPWSHSDVYFEPFFRDAGSMWEVVIGRPDIYASFLALSIVRGIARAGFVLNYALLAVPFLYWGHRRLSLKGTPIERLLLWSFVGFIPLVTLAYPHIRYMARYYPIAMLLLLIAFERLMNAPRDSMRTALLAGVGSSLLFSLVLNLQRLTASLYGIAETSQYWFPD